MSAREDNFYDYHTATDGFEETVILEGMSCGVLVNHKKGVSYHPHGLKGPTSLFSTSNTANPKATEQHAPPPLAHGGGATDNLRGTHSRLFRDETIEFDRSLHRRSSMRAGEDFASYFDLLEGQT